MLALLIFLIGCSAFFGHAFAAAAGCGEIGQIIGAIAGGVLCLVGLLGD